jgi:NAD(P)-dependent dehydrogenase (short-subunit alcohol dehydrogenase family)
MTVDGRVALITGGARRIGHALALALAGRGAHVVVSYRTSAPEAHRTVAALSARGATALAVQADLTRAAEVRGLMRRIERRFGRLDVLINSAAVFPRTPFATLTERDWDGALDANLKGPFLCALYASRLMRRAGGKIVNITDWAGLRPYRHYLPYCVSKAGLIGLTQALAKELAPRIQVNAVALGPILPPPRMSRAEQARIARQVPLGRWGDPQDVVNTVVFLLEGAEFMTGSTVVVDGGRLIA